MHSYDHRKDPESKVLELIMTAPMIVTNWINLQYYASAVDNRAFGSGNKAIHNVVGQLGVLLGNGGDLMTGLPWQSVHDGERFQHDPLRLLVVIEASRDAVQGIIQKHSLVQDLVSNGWLSLVVLDQEQFHRWTSDGTWVAESFDGQRNNSFRDFPHGVGKRRCRATRRTSQFSLVLNNRYGSLEGRPREDYKPVRFLCNHRVNPTVATRREDGRPRPSIVCLLEYVQSTDEDVRRTGFFCNAGFNSCGPRSAIAASIVAGSCLDDWLNGRFVVARENASHQVDASA